MLYRPTSPAALFPLLFHLLIGVLTIPSIRAIEKEELRPQVPIDVLEKAMRFVKEQNYGDSDGNSLQVKERLESGNIHQLYKVAHAMNEMKNQDDVLASIEIWHALADGEDGGDVLSQFSLGIAYSENYKAKAITYFVQAGETGPHQTALYNAGRLLADPEVEDFVKALAYLRAAYSLGETHPKYSTARVTEVSKLTYEQLSEQLVMVINQSMSTTQNVISLQHVADMFLYADLNNFPPAESKEEKNWVKAMQSLQSEEWDKALIEFEKLEKNSKEKLSDLQIALLQFLNQYCKSASIYLSDEL